ncbi:MAG TPA: hypothetical protein VFV19_12615 [Candidatus Polarisedimenticolaceae bacterium]|nr:hypothetical protein [Candidatus Polarisedimenticolaceae bacterium]
MNAVFKSSGAGVLVGVCVSAILLTACFFAAGGGHGTYIPAIVLFPYTMVWAGALKRITLPSLLLAVGQFPAYGGIAGWARSRQRSMPAVWVMASVHVVAVLLALSAVGETFLP